MNKPSTAFFDTLGLYVYQYIDQDTLKPYYTGKGVGDRCWSHVKDKGFDPSDCYIVARNLGRFFEKQDGAAFLLESFLIFQQSPDKNSVSGHYKDCFIMSSLSFLFDNFVNEQRNMFNELNELVSSNSEVFDGTIGYTETRGSSFYVETGMRENVYFGIKVQTKEPNVTVIVKANSDKFFEPLVEKMKANLGKAYDLDTTSNKNAISFPVETLEEAVSLWESFTK